MDRVDEYLGRIEQLPPAPTVAVQLLTLFRDTDRDLDRVVEIISHDPALTAVTLKRCNSASFAGDTPVSDMFEAVSRLGLYEVYCAVLALMASRTMTQVRAKYSADATRLWKHTVTTAVTASVLAKRVQESDAAAFTAGLLHDIGKLIFVSVEGIAYAELVRKSGGHGHELAAAEELSMGFSHATLGSRLLNRWGLPEDICLAVQLHHQSPMGWGRYQTLAAVINFANCLAHEIIEGPVFAPAAATVNPDTMGLVGLTAKDIPSLMPEIHKNLEEVQELMQMQG